MLLPHAILLALVALPQGHPEPVEPQFPWVVVDRPEPSPWDNLHNAQLIVRSDGSLIAIVEHSGHYGSPLGTYVYKSTDRGSRWSKPATVYTPNDAGLFEAGGTLYLLGTYSSAGKSPGRAEICRSLDGGATWGDMTLLGSEARLQTSQSEVLRDHGRIWQIFAKPDYSGGETISHLSVASAPADSDLMKSENWTWSEELSQTGFGWQCSLLAPGREGGTILLGRTYGPEVKLVADLTSDGRGLRVRSSGDLPELPSRSVRSLSHDPSSGQTFALNCVDRPAPDWGFSEIRLASSSDLAHWTDRSVLLRGGREDGIAFGWCAHAYDGEDLLVLLCARVPRVPDSGEKATREWNVLFLRVPRFRDRKPETPPLWDAPH
ncbi:MAG TPA: sialidase family protein [Planctomycetota bacterium]|jgi:hypothetical protein|nr:sialidase family protein [Planctomycetota bacterium]